MCFNSADEGFSADSGVRVPSRGAPDFNCTEAYKRERYQNHLCICYICCPFILLYSIMVMNLPPKKISLIFSAYFSLITILFQINQIV